MSVRQLILDGLNRVFRLRGMELRAVPTDETDVYGSSAPNSRVVPQTTIDHEIAERKMPAPYFLKLDTHGFEVPILSGASASLARTALVMVEAYNFSFCPGCLRFHELCVWLETLGFRPCDLIEPMRWPRDGALWQMDLVFARREHPAFASSSYR
jgi:hypothetical protein